MPSTPRRDDDPRRANPPRRADYAKQFQKDWQRLARSGRYDMRRLKQAMLLLIANEGTLPPEYRDHELTGDWRDHRECHVGGDFLLIYHINAAGDVIFVRAGTHAELFR
jgi:mRNA interferase YafQ